MSSIGSYSSLPFTAFANPGSEHAQEADEQQSKPLTEAGPDSGAAADSSEKSDGAATAGEKAPNGETLTEEELAQVRELKARDREVRAHEQAHLAAAGPHAKGGPRYTYQVGPDGRRYATGGEVSIDTSKVPGDPEATIRKARQIRAAALAPAEPSSQDRAVAAAAARLLAEAQGELQQLQREKVELSGAGGEFEQASTGAAADPGRSTPFESGILVDRAV